MRIAGLLSSDPVSPIHSYLDKILERLRLHSDWKMIRKAEGAALMGWCGWHEPNVAHDNGLLVVMDGFIYNRSDWDAFPNDAALFTQLYQKYGFEEALKKINGDFSIALYDKKDHSLWVARDRLGVKPLYYTKKNDWFVFASQPAALFELPEVTKEINHKFVALFAASHYRYIDNNPEASPYRDIAQLPAAHYLCVKKGCVTQTCYWSLTNQGDFTDPEYILAKRYRHLLLDAVSLRLQSAQRPGFTLSGGMDSSSILSLAGHTTGSKQHAFSSVYEDKTYDESHDIQSMLTTQVEWHPIKVETPDIFATLKRMIAIHNEPVATATWLSHFVLCNEVSKRGFTSLFGGLGGDELNAGEYEYFLFNFADLHHNGCEEQLSQEVERWIEYHNHPVFQKNHAVMEQALKDLVDLQTKGFCKPDRKRLLRYQKTLNPDYFDLNSFEPTMDHPFDSYLKNRTYQDLFRETIPCCLRAEDRQTTAFNLDNFLPFFDHRLVEFMYQVPGHMKIRNGITKRLLREAMKGILPEETRTRIAKMGWNAPAHVWFAEGCREPLLDMIHSQRFRERNIYNISAVERLVDEHYEIINSGLNKDNHMMFLWQLINVELWLSYLETA